MVYAYIKYGYLTIFNKINFIFQTRIIESPQVLVPMVNKMPPLFLSAASAVFLHGGKIWKSVHLQAAHFVNSLLKSLLIFPMYFQQVDISEVVDQPYWDHAVNWDGQVGVMFFVNLAIILIGLAFLISRNKVLGTVPLVIALFYNLASALATTSGGRYLKPSIWVFILYFLAGIFYLLDRLFLTARFVPGAFEKKLIVDNRKPGSSTQAWGLRLAAAFLLAIGLIVPLADATIPRKYPDVSWKQVFAMLPEDAFRQLGFERETLQRLVHERELNVYYGEAQYPRQMNPHNGIDYFGFSVVGPFPSIGARLFEKSEFNLEFPPGSLVVAIGCSKPVGNLQLDDMILVYLVEKNLFYSTGMDWQVICPVLTGN